MPIDERLKPFRGVVLIFAGFIALIALSAAMLFLLKLGLAPAKIATYYRGSEETFAQPKSMAGMLKVAVPHLLAASLAFFVTIHLVGYVGLVGRRQSTALTAAAFFALFASVVSAFAIRYVSPALAIAKLVSFVGLEALLLLWIGLLVAAFWPARRRARASVAQPSIDAGATASS